MLSAPAVLKQCITSDPHFLANFLQQLANAEERVRDHELYYFHAITLLHPVLIQVFADLPANSQEVHRYPCRKFDQVCFRRWWLSTPVCVVWVGLRC